MILNDWMLKILEKIKGTKLGFILGEYIFPFLVVLWIIITLPYHLVKGTYLGGVVVDDEDFEDYTKDFEEVKEVDKTKEKEEKITIKNNK